MDKYLFSTVSLSQVFEVLFSVFLFPIICCFLKSSFSSSLSQRGAVCRCGVRLQVVLAGARRHEDHSCIVRGERSRGGRLWESQEGHQAKSGVTEWEWAFRLHIPSNPTEKGGLEKTNLGGSVYTAFPTSVSIQWLLYIWGESSSLLCLSNA